MVSVLSGRAGLGHSATDGLTYQSTDPPRSRGKKKQNLSLYRPLLAKPSTILTTKEKRLGVQTIITEQGLKAVNLEIRGKIDNLHICETRFSDEN